MAKKSTRKSKLRRLSAGRPVQIGIGLVILLILAGGAWAIWGRSDSKPVATPVAAASKSQKPYVNLSPPTNQDLQDSADHKQVDLQPPPPTPTASDGRKAVTPIVTSASLSDIDGYVTGVFEDGGTCTATITNTTTHQVITKTSAGFANASYTSCTPIHPNLASGSWSVVLSYSSSTAVGVSAAQEFH